MRPTPWEPIFSGGAGSVGGTVLGRRSGGGGSLLPPWGASAAPAPAPARRPRAGRAGPAAAAAVGAAVRAGAPAGEGRAAALEDVLIRNLVLFFSSEGGLWSHFEVGFRSVALAKLLPASW